MVKHCIEGTSDGKPYCIKHIRLMPYVGTMCFDLRDEIRAKLASGPRYVGNLAVLVVANRAEVVKTIREMPDVVVETVWNGRGHAKKLARLVA